MDSKDDAADDGILTWRQAREALMTWNGYGANAAQDILDDLARRAQLNPNSSWSFLNAERQLRWVQYAGNGGPGRPLFRVSAVRPGFEKESTAGKGQHAPE
jgi:hypothetical protein